MSQGRLRQRGAVSPEAIRQAECLPDLLRKVLICLGGVGCYFYAVNC
jgi:hypothetical protein